MLACRGRRGVGGWEGRNCGGQGRRRRRKIKKERREKGEEGGVLTRCAARSVWLSLNQEPPIFFHKSPSSCISPPPPAALQKAVGNSDGRWTPGRRENYTAKRQALSKRAAGRASEARAPLDLPGGRRGRWRDTQKERKKAAGFLSSELSGPRAGRPEAQGSASLYPICSLSGSQRLARPGWRKGR